MGRLFKKGASGPECQRLVSEGLRNSRSLSGQAGGESGRDTGQGCFSAPNGFNSGPQEDRSKLLTPGCHREFDLIWKHGFANVKKSFPGFWAILHPMVSRQPYKLKGWT